VTSEERVACPYCKEMILLGAIKCKECGSNLAKRWSGAQTAGQSFNFGGQSFNWVRNQPNRKVFGVAACIAHNLRLSATLIRLIFVVLTFIGFLGPILYFALMAILPAEPGTRSLFETIVDAVGAAVDNFQRRGPVVASGAVPPSGAAIPPDSQPAMAQLPQAPVLPNPPEPNTPNA
jgi:phage shock protein C